MHTSSTVIREKGGLGLSESQSQSGKAGRTRRLPCQSDARMLLGGIMQPEALCAPRDDR